MLGDDAKAGLTEAMMEVWRAEMARHGLSGRAHETLLAAGEADVASTVAGLDDATPGTITAWLCWYKTWAKDRVGQHVARIVAAQKARDPKVILRREREREAVWVRRSRLDCTLEDVISFARGHGGAVDMTPTNLGAWQASTRLRTPAKLLDHVRRIVASGYGKLVRGIRRRPERFVLLDLRPNVRKIG